MGGIRFSVEIWTPKKYLNLKMFGNIGGTMAKTNKCRQCIPTSVDFRQCQQQGADSMN